MKYFSHVNKKKFVQALAILSPKFRYSTPKRQWFAMRLGLYRTVLQRNNRFLTKFHRSFLVTTIAEVKRQYLSESQAKHKINYILYERGYKKFRSEFIKEVVSSYPEVIFDFLENTRIYNDSLYFQGLYITLQYDYSKSLALNKNYIHNLITNSRLDYINKRCLLNNYLSDSVLTKLNNLNDIFIYQNLSSVHLRDNNTTFVITNLDSVIPSSGQKLYSSIGINNKVTVIVTSYNSSKTIVSSIESLINQTWSDLEVIVVDDASTDDTLEKLERLQKQHNSMLKVISLSQNVGTFAAKSIGAEYAKGKFLTCQDSDDWAHPQKIAEQVIPLIENSALVATTSQWLRLDEYGQYYVRNIYPFVMQNPASPMFRLDMVKQNIGLWHLVRAGADSEFYERLKLAYGQESIMVVRKVLTIASHRLSSLMNSEEFGTRSREGALSRLNYWEAWRLWHINLLHKKMPLRIPSLYQQVYSNKPVFLNIPNNIDIDKKSLQQVLEAVEMLNIS